MTSYAVKALLNVWVSKRAMRTKLLPWYFRIFHQDHSSSIDFRMETPTTLAQTQNVLSLWNLFFKLIKLIIFPVIPTFCEDRFLLSLMIIGLKQLACIHHSIEGQMSKLVDSNDETITAYLREAQQSGNKSSQWILVHKDHNSSCQMFSALKCNIVNMPHQFNSRCLKIHIS